MKTLRPISSISLLLALLSLGAHAEDKLPSAPWKTPGFQTAAPEAEAPPAAAPAPQAAAPQAPAHSPAKGEKLRLPIVLVHGATMGGARLVVGPFDYGDYWAEIPDYLKKLGADVSVVELPTDASIEERGTVLYKYLEDNFKDRRVNIVAHSLGGLDARYAAGVLKSNRIATITTIATPHLGSPLSNWAMRQAKFSGFWYKLFKFFGFDLQGRRFLPEITTDFMQTKFNPNVPDRGDIRYFSVVCTASAGSRGMSWMLWMPYRWLKGESNAMAVEKNDGLVPKSSQAWGKVILELEMDHLAEINHHEWRFHDMRAESLALYSGIYDYLLREGY